MQILCANYEVKNVIFAFNSLKYVKLILQKIFLIHIFNLKLKAIAVKDRFLKKC